MHAIGPLTGTATGENNGGIGNNKAFTIFTGDLTSHDNDNQLSRAYVEYVQSAIYSLFKAYLAGPVYAVLVCLFYLRLYFSMNVLDRVTMTRGPKLLMHLTAYSQRLFQTSLNGTMHIWQISGKPKGGFQVTLQRSPGPHILLTLPLLPLDSRLLL
jgi:hypothetical protein